MSNENWEGNASTILTWIWVIVAPYLSEYFTQDQFVTVGIAIVGLIIAVWSSYNPNTFRFLKNDKKEADVCVCAETEEDLINAEYESKDGCQYEEEYEQLCEIRDDIFRAMYEVHQGRDSLLQT